jgi:hypothetical protein
MNGAAAAKAMTRIDSARSGRRLSVSRPVNSASTSESDSGSANSQNSGPVNTSESPALTNFSERSRGMSSDITQ